MFPFPAEPSKVSRILEPVSYAFLGLRLLAFLICIMQVGSVSNAADTAWQPLARIQVNGLPSTPVSLSLTRVTYEVGATRSSPSRPATALAYIESGSLEMQSTMALTVLRSAEDASNRLETIDPGNPVTISPNESVFILQNAETSVRNAGNQPASVLVTEIAQADQSGPTLPPPDATPGILAKRLSFVEAKSVPADHTIIELGRLTLGPGAKISTTSPPGIFEPHAGPELAVVESGTLAVTVSTGEVNILREGIQSQKGEDRAPLHSESILRPGDAMMSQAGSVDIVSNTAKIPAAVILVRLLPTTK